MPEIPYPPVFRDWRPEARENRVSTYQSTTGVQVEMHNPEFGKSVWYGVELTEGDATLFAAALLERAGHKKLVARILRKLDKEAARV